MPLFPFSQTMLSIRPQKRLSLRYPEAFPERT